MSKLKDEQCAAFNLWRKENVGKTLSTKEVVTALNSVFDRKIGRNILPYLIIGENPPITKIDKGEYKVNDKPVHIERLKNCFKALTKKQKTANANWRAKQDAKSADTTTISITTPVLKEKSLEERIQDSIKLLKENGYQVRKIKIEYEEV